MCVGRRSTSSQRTGVGTVGQGTPRSECGATVCRAGSFWSRSTYTLPIAEQMPVQPSFDEVQWAILETNGQISFVKK